MATVTERIALPVTPEHAFDYVADFTNSPEWDPAISSARRLEGVGAEVGARVRVRFGAGPVRIPLDYEITHADSPDRVVLETRSAVHHGRDDIRLHATPEGVEIVWEATFGFNGPGRLLDPLLRPSFASVAERAAQGLRDTLRPPAEAA